MYCEHFGFDKEPFGVSPDARFFRPTAQHAEATAALYYAISQRRGFAVLIGPPGLGKTSVLVNLAERIAAEARVVFFVHPKIEGAAVLESVLFAMGINPEPDPTQRLRQLNRFLLGLYNDGKTCVVMFDEAQHLSVESLETIRMLSNFETSQKLIQFVLAGQPALADLLNAPECEQVLQRVSVIARLERLSEQQVEAYIEDRTKIAGASENPFTPGAVRAIAEASKGIPRNINTLCFNALTLAFSDGRKTVDAECVHQTVRDLNLSTVAPPGRANSAPAVQIALSPESARWWRRPLLLAAAVMLLTAVCFAPAFIAR